MADPLNLLDVAAVPITLLVDQYGVIRYRNPSNADLATFMKQSYKPDGTKAKKLPDTGSMNPDRLAMQGKTREAAAAYQKLLDSTKNRPVSGRLHFRLGVVHRMAFDANGNPGDFAKAVKHWREALAINGGQYIWRRRIQQYGPVADKPYPFYNWVSHATAEIKKRGEVPVQLKVKLSSSELASKNTKAQQNQAMEKPEIKGISTDNDSIEIQPVLLPDTSGRRSIYRVHLLLKPKSGAKYTWNNEAGPVKIWLEPSSLGQIAQQGIEIPVDTTKPTSSETRSVEFEWKATKGSQLNGIAIYHVCDKKSGQCTILTKRFTVKR